MIHKSGTGDASATVVYTHAAAPGFFDIGLASDGADVTVRLYLNASASGMPAASQSQPAAIVTRFLEPGDEISFDVDDSGSHPWVFDISLFAKGDIAYEAP